jgi:hypothetical protein
MTRDEPSVIIRDLFSYSPDVVRGAMAQAAERGAEMTPHLMRLLERAADNVREPDLNIIGAELAMFLLAARGECRALDPIVRILRGSNELCYDVVGDTLFESVPAILVTLAGDDLTTVIELARDKSLHTDPRAAACGAINVAVANGRMSREEALDIIGSILRAELSRPGADETLIQDVSGTALYLAPREIESELRAAHAGGFLDENLSMQEIEECLATSPDEAIRDLQADWHNRLITDAIEATAWWAFFRARDDDDWDDDWDERLVETVRYDEPKPGRNAPCPCGSGKKYKKCCGA